MLDGDAVTELVLLEGVDWFGEWESFVGETFELDLFVVDVVRSSFLKTQNSFWGYFCDPGLEVVGAWSLIRNSKFTLLFAYVNVFKLDRMHKDSWFIPQ